METIFDCLQLHAEPDPDRLAILAPERAPLTFAGLVAQIRATVAQLNACGLGRGDRVALVLPNGPEFAAAFLSIASGATTVPLNPGYTSAEFEYYLADLRARALVVGQGTDSRAVAAAQKLGLTVLALEPQLDQPAGTFTLHGPPRPLTGASGLAEPEDIALLLHTSGTTARPKRVPLTHRNLLAAARHYHPLLKISPKDRCLNMAAMYHIQALQAMLLAPLSGGASVVCTAGFSAAYFFDWLDEFQPTWYAGGPALHQTVIDLARARGQAPLNHSLRFIRSGAAAASNALQRELEQLFRVPVLDAYGMSELVPIASVPLPPAPRKPGSVGPSAGPELAIVTPGTATRLPAGASGEIIVRDAALINGYDDDPAANAAAFVDGWFRTGDLGYLDEDGWLFITGRLKEMINYGGEKIAPAEVEAALLAHPAVAEAAVFAMPEAQYGEAPAAAVVLRAGAAYHEQELRRFAAVRLADFKVPRRIVVVPELPKGPTGKVKRLSLARELNLTAPAVPVAAPFEPPADALEARLAALWGQMLGGATIGRHDNFFDRGGHSLLATGLVTQMEALVGRPLPASLLVEAPTLAELAAVLRQPPKPPEGLVPLQTQGRRRPFFFVHDIGGGVLRFAELARRVGGDDQPFYALEAAGLHSDQAPHARVEVMAAHYLRLIRQVQASGPYYLGGYCFGGVVVYEMARQLEARGETAALVAVVEGYAPFRARRAQPFTGARVGQFLANVPRVVADYRALGWRPTAQRVGHVGNQWARQVGVRLGLSVPLRVQDIVAGAERLSAREQQVLQAHLAASRDYDPGPYAGRVTLLNVHRQSLLLDPDPRRGWQRLAQGGLTLRVIAGSHHNILLPQHVGSLADALRASLDEAQPAGVAPPAEVA